MSYKRKMFVFCAVLLLTAVSAGYVLVTAVPAAASPSPAGAANDEIHWTIIGPTSVALDWRGPSKSLRYGLTTAYGKTVTAVAPSHKPYSSAGPFWEAKLTGLKPNTTYHYSIGGEADHTFKTAPPKGSSGFKVDVIADVGATTSYKNVGPVMAMIAADRPSLALVVGDLTYGHPEGQAVVDQHFKDVQAWSLGSTAYMPIWGNHEWDTPADDNLNNYKGRFALPNPQTSPGSPSVSCCGEDWYYFDYGNARFIAYPEPYSGAWADWNTKAKVLMDAAQADPAITFIITFGHRPAYSSGYHHGDTTLESYLDALGATHSKYVLNLNGHSHNYERTYPQSNVVHITAGMGGSALEQSGSCLWEICTQPAWSAKRYMRHGVVRLTFGATSIYGAFVCGPAGGGTNDINCTQGQVVDTFTITPKPTAKALTLNSNSVYDGWALELGENLNKGGSINAAATSFRLGDDTARKQYRSILSFSTASLPDNAVITKVTLKIRRSGVTGSATLAMFQGLMADVKKGYFGAKTGLEMADFQAGASKTSGPFSPALVSNWYSLDLTAGKAYINKSSYLGGLTQIRLRFKLDDNNNKIANFMSFYSGNAATVANRPKLIITYIVP